jgi:hypothetical protein
LIARLAHDKVALKKAGGTLGKVFDLVARDLSMHEAFRHLPELEAKTLQNSFPTLKNNWRDDKKRGAMLTVFKGNVIAGYGADPVAEITKLMQVCLDAEDGYKEGVIKKKSAGKEVVDNQTAAQAAVERHALGGTISLDSDDGSPLSGGGSSSGSDRKRPRTPVAAPVDDEFLNIASEWLCISAEYWQEGRNACMHGRGYGSSALE